MLFPLPTAVQRAKVKRRSVLGVASWSLPDEAGCSFNSLHTLAQLADATALDPCDSQLGPFHVSSTFRGGRYLSECDGRYGACDAADRFLLSIVRTP
jgi:hypothetical protein